MKTYKIYGFIMQKNNDKWQKIGDEVGIKLPDDANPYEAIQSNFKLIASHWLFMIKEIKEE